jgi:hypothetical protein
MKCKRTVEVEVVRIRVTEEVGPPNEERCRLDARRAIEEAVRRSRFFPPGNPVRWHDDEPS